MKFKRLSDRKLEVRNQIIRYSWEKYKGVLTMEELADCFRLDTSRIWIIVNPKKPDKEKIKRGQDYLNKK